MGCECANSKEDKKNEISKDSPRNGEEQNDQNIFGLNNQEPQYNMKNINELEKIKNNKNENYSDSIIEIINKIRQDPVSYADIIEQSIINIIEDVEKNKIIYKKKVKVALTKGEPAFKEAAEKLRMMSPLPPLLFKQEICIPLPNEEEDIKDSSYLKEQVKIIRENYNIDVFFKDLIKIPEVSALLMIVDDSGKNPGRKRQAVLNPNFKYIGVTSKFIGKTFVAYFSFSK